MADDIRSALDTAGYTHEPATEEALKACFLDYVAAGYFADLDLEDCMAEIENGAITTTDMIRSLGRRKRP